MFTVMMMMVVTTVISILQVYKSLMCVQAKESLKELFTERWEEAGGEGSEQPETHPFHFRDYTWPERTSLGLRPLVCMMEK